MTRRARVRGRAAGFSLLEVVLALAIFGMAAVMLTELANSSLRRAADCRDVTQAQFIAESIMSELVVGVRDLANVANAEYRGEGEGLLQQANWNYSVQIATGEIEGLLSVTVTVQQNLDDETRAAEFSLVRLIQDPDAIPVEEESTSTSTAALLELAREGRHV